jgi:hypothetical protein
MMDTGTSTGEITGHNKVTSAACSGFVYFKHFLRLSTLSLYVINDHTEQPLLLMTH